MGYRTTLTTNDYSGTLPQWFIDKYSEYYFIADALVSSKVEVKHYDNYFCIDYQRALKDIGFFERIGGTRLVAMGEDGVITRVTITSDSIKYEQAIEYDEIDGIYNM